MPDVFTPEQIAQLLEAFFKAVGTRQYIGARYVPLFGRKDEESIEWDNSAPYEPLTIVLYQGNSFTSRQYVPAGVEITNEDFWAITGNYNAQIEEYRRIAANALQTANEAQESAGNAQNDIDTLLPKTAFSNENTVKDYIDDFKESYSQTIENLSNALPLDSFSETTVKSYIDNAINSEKEKQAGWSGRLFNVERPHYMGWIPVTDYPNRIPAAGCAINAHRWVQCFSSDANDGQITVVDFTANTLFYSAPAQIGHANGCAYDPNTDTLYVAVGRYGSSSAPVYTNDILSFSINYADQSITYLRTYTPAWSLGGETLYIKGIAYDSVTGKFVVNTRYGAQFGVFEPATGSITDTVVAEKTLPSQAPQGIAANDGFVYQLLSNPNAIATYNLKTGKLLGVDVFGICNDIDVSIREVEGICFYDNVMYACSYLGNPVGTDCFMQVLRCDKPNTVRYYEYANALYVDRGATNYAGNGTSAANALPFVNIINDYHINLTTLYVRGDYEGYGTNNDISFRNGCQIGRIDFAHASNITRMDFLGLDHVYITGLTLVGKPTVRNSALYFASCGDVIITATNFTESELNASDIALNYVASLLIQGNVTVRQNDTLHISRSINCPVFSSISTERFTISGDTPNVM